MSETETMSRGERTRTQLLDLAQAAILEKGYAATSIDELIAAAGLTKSGFFYHFSEKIDLGKALLRRDNVLIEAAMTRMFEEADAAHDDPLDALVFALAQYAEAAAATGDRPGCLAAAFSYQEALFDDDVRALMREAFALRRRIIRARLERIAAQRPPRTPIDLDALADMAIAVLQGAMVVDRVRNPPPILRAQMDLYRTFLRALFAARDRED
jgi:TetR/AcrR family transcriptional regulator, transcriptional repressor for nem operon